MENGTNTPGSGPIESTSKANTDAPGPAPILSLSQLKDKYAARQRQVEIPVLGASIIVRKLPASILTQGDLGEQSPLMLALKYGVAEPEIDDEMIAALTFEEANAIYEEVEKWNPGVLSSDESEDADRRQEFPG